MKNEMTLNDWCKECFELAKSKGWHENEDSDNFFIKLLLLHSELSEVVEELRAGKKITDFYFKDGKPEGPAIELADVQIRLFDLCGKAGIDLEKMVKIKHEYNATRPHRHGGKVI
jgi:NTP pyrophosphatase (non-canonical NTP hydrolase)